MLQTPWSEFSGEKGGLERAGGGFDRLPVSVALEQLLGVSGELAADFAALTFAPGNVHRIVGGGLVAHPGNRGGFSALFDRDALGAGNGTTADGDRERDNAPGHDFGEVGVAFVEVEELQDGARKL